MSEIEIRAANIDDAGELLTLQRAAFLVEAQLYGTTDIEPLNQTLDELEAELGDVVCLAALNGARIVGSVRMAARGPVAEIARLMVAPDWQGQGVGTRLMSTVERWAPDDIQRFELVTGHKSTANIALYNRLGYSVFRRHRANDLITFVHMTKPRAC